LQLAATPLFSSFEHASRADGFVLPHAETASRQMQTINFIGQPLLYVDSFSFVVLDRFVNQRPELDESLDAPEARGAVP